MIDSFVYRSAQPNSWRCCTKLCCNYNCNYNRRCI